MAADHLVAFLTARLDEDEALARMPKPAEDDDDWVDLFEQRSGQWHTAHCGWRTGEGLSDDCVCSVPARVLDDVAAKRAVLERYAHYLDQVRAYRSSRWSEAMNAEDRQKARMAEARHRVAEDVARLLAQPYAGHPDFATAWKRP